MTKNRKYLTSAQPLKFNGTQIILNSSNIVLTKKNHMGYILLITNYNIDSISSKKITRKKLLFKE